MKTNIRYNGPDRKANDAAAIKDIKDYLGPKAWKILEAMPTDPACTIHHVNMGMAFAGIEGYPSTPSVAPISWTSTVNGCVRKSTVNPAWKLTTKVSRSKRSHSDRLAP